MRFRYASQDDVPALAAMNLTLIRDEGHRNTMSVAELCDRLSEWLAGEHRAVLFEDNTGPMGYALYRLDPDWTYLQQFLVLPEYRRQGVGRAALDWLFANAWVERPRIRLDVLIGNRSGVAFWRSVGFADYCLTMERKADPKPA